ncbi:vicilin-like seed storage protein At2g18540 [Zingiber officinale]|uniref:vicilin-like seed storage protein At2g18540 n=1 Tax=Zingiber officinale TaxID=94328 RepID=UPI001C4C084B|nr:vicilin-like seed storage protein At2g18540 [Zingiber officinale]
MRKRRNGSTAQEEEDRAAHRKKSKRQEEEEEETGSEDDSSGSDGESYRSKRKGRRHHSSKREHRRRGRSSGREPEHSASSDSCSESDTEESGSQLESETSKSEDEARRRRRREKRKEQEREYEERKRRKEKYRRKRRKMEKEEKRKKRKDKKREKETAKKGAVTNSWGKYGIIKEVDMWNKRPEFTAWLAEVKQVNLEILSNREEKQMFKEFMEDHNTATFPSKKYYNLDAYHRRKMEKEMKKGPQKIQEMERSVFNDEEQRRIELLRERERQKEEQVEALKRSMQGGMAQAMKEQSRLKEEMMYQYKLGNYEAAAAIQRRLDPDIAM